MTYPTYKTDCGKYQIIPINPNVATVVPVVEQASQPTYQPVTEQSQPKPQGIPIPLIAIGGLLCFLVLNPGTPSGPTISELQAENQYLRQKVSELHHQLIGVYSAQ